MTHVSGTNEVPRHDGGKHDMSTYPPEPTPGGDASAYRGTAAPTIPNRLLSVGDLVSGAFRTLTADPRLFLLVPVAVAAALLLPVLILVGVGVALASTSDGSAAAAVTALLAAVLAVAVAVVLVRISAALVIAAYRVALGERPALRALWNETRGIIWNVLGLYLLIVGAVVVVGVLAILLIGGSVAADEGFGIGVMLLLLFLAYPVMIWLSVKCAFIFQTVAIEKAGPIEAIRRTFVLTKGMWWVTLGRQLMLSLLALPLMFVFSLASAPFSALTRDSGDASSVAGGIVAAIVMGIGAIALYIFQLYSVVYSTLMYIDARRRESLGGQAHAYGSPQQDYVQPAYQPGGYPYGPAASGSAAGAVAGSQWNSPAYPGPAPVPSSPYPQQPYGQYPQSTTDAPAYPESGGSLWSGSPSSSDPTAPMPQTGSDAGGSDSGGGSWGGDSSGGGDSGGGGGDSGGSSSD